MKTPREMILEYAEKQFQKEKDKWNSGMKNNYFAWEDMCDWLKENLK